MEKPKYIDWLVSEEDIVFEDGIPLNCYKLDYNTNAAFFDDWALHLRRHYTYDDELRDSISIHEIEGLSVEEYLRKYIIPQKDEAFGPTARSNDITEILFSDLFQFVLNYTVPRCKQHNRSGKNQSEHGTDIIAYKYNHIDKIPNRLDELLVIEVKSGISSESYDPIIDSISDSHKYDEVRHALTLDFYRKKLNSINNIEQSKDITRFLLKSKFPYKITYIGAGINSKEYIENKVIIGIEGDSLNLRSDNKVFLVHGKRLMELTHEIFERCTRWY